MGQSYNIKDEESTLQHTQQRTRIKKSDISYKYQISGTDIMKIWLCCLYAVFDDCGKVSCGKAVSLLCHLTIHALNPAGHVMHQQFNIQQLYVLPTLYLCVFYLSENSRRIVPLTA